MPIRPYCFPHLLIPLLTSMSMTQTYIAVCMLMTPGVITKNLLQHIEIVLSGII
jgi:hypothetical protein